MITEKYFGKIIDTHTHLFPNKIAEKATAAVGDFYSLPMETVGTTDNLMEHMSAFGVRHSFILSVATSPLQVRNINDFLIGIIKENSNLFTAFGTVHIDTKDPLEELDYMRQKGITGLKFHNDFQGFAVDDPKLDPIYEKCQAEKIPIIFHAGDQRYKLTNPKQFRNVGRKFPELIGIAAHFGGYSQWIDIDDDYCKDSPFWFDTSSSLFKLDKNEVTRLISVRGADKILFGTDFPMWKAEGEYSRLEELDLNEELLEKILYKNAENFLSTIDRTVK